jgi:hypothetical protein
MQAPNLATASTDFLLAGGSSGLLDFESSIGPRATGSPARALDHCAQPAERVRLPLEDGR